MTPKTKNSIVLTANAGLLGVTLARYVLLDAVPDLWLVPLVLGMGLTVALRRYYGKQEAWTELCGGDCLHCTYDREF